MGYNVLWKVKGRNIDMLRRELSMKYHLLMNVKAWKTSPQRNK